MVTEKHVNEELELLQATVRLSGKLLGVVLGLIMGVGVFLVTNWLILKGGPVDEATGQEVVGPHLGLLAQYFPGYSVSIFGSFVGLLYGFLLGAITGLLVAWIYNKIALKS